MCLYLKCLLQLTQIDWLVDDWSVNEYFANILTIWKIIIFLEINLFEQPNLVIQQLDYYQNAITVIVGYKFKSNLKSKIGSKLCWFLFRRLLASGSHLHIFLFQNHVTYLKDEKTYTHLLCTAMSNSREEK